MQENKTRRRKGEGYVFKVKNTFYLQYRDEAGIKHAFTLKRPTGEKITEEREARVAAAQFLERKRKIDDIETREEYLEKKAELKKLKARLTIKLDDAFELHMQKPHARHASKQVLKVSRRYWADFVAFAKGEYGLENLDQVERTHAEAYIAYIRTNGRYDTTIRYHKETAPHRKPFRDYEYGGNLSARTLNRYQSVCKAVFTFLSGDLGYTIEENPFFYIKPLKLETVDREIFSAEELELIFRNPPPLMKGLFLIGLTTGLRLGDVATLRWRNIEKTFENGIPNFMGKEIHLATSKTNVLVHIPIEYELAEYLKAQWEISGNTEFVLPEAAEMYSGISHKLNTRILSYIKSLGIDKYRVIPGRKRKQSVKDFHSLRHCFCYYAGIRGVPLPVVQSIVGHLSQAMTRHYQNHADRAARLKAISQMRGFLYGNGNSTQKTGDILRNRIIDFANSASDMQILRLNIIIDKLTEGSQIMIDSAPKLIS